MRFSYSSLFVLLLVFQPGFGFNEDSVARAGLFNSYSGNWAAQMGSLLEIAPNSDTLNRIFVTLSSIEGEYSQPSAAPGLSFLPTEVCQTAIPGACYVHLFSEYPFSKLEKRTGAFSLDWFDSVQIQASLADSGNMYQMYQMDELWDANDMAAGWELISPEENHFFMVELSDSLYLAVLFHEKDGRLDSDYMNFRWKVLEAGDTLSQEYFVFDEPLIVSQDSILTGELDSVSAINGMHIASLDADGYMVGVRSFDGDYSSSFLGNFDFSFAYEYTCTVKFGGCSLVLVSPYTFWQTSTQSDFVFTEEGLENLDVCNDSQGNCQMYSLWGPNSAVSPNSPVVYYDGHFFVVQMGDEYLGVLLTEQYQGADLLKVDVRWWSLTLGETISVETFEEPRVKLREESSSFRKIQGESGNDFFDLKGRFLNSRNAPGMWIPHSQ
jgi:hypothetical protein